MGKGTLRTRLCAMLGIEYPIVLAGMGRQSGCTLAAAVSNAGGLGIVGATYLDPEQLHRWIGRMRELTDKPFGVDILAPAIGSMPSTREEIVATFPKEHVNFVDRLKKEIGVPEPTTWGHRYRLSPTFINEQIQVVLEERPAVFASALGLEPALLPRLHARGVKVFSMVGNVRTARRSAAAGADVIIAQGHESGGHTGRIGTLALVPQVVDAVRPVPVLAAGGIGDGRGLAAALMLGAEGVWVGTAFLCCDEAFVDYVKEGIISQGLADSHKQRILQATEEDTRVTRIYTGKTCRTLNDKLIERWEKERLPTLPLPFQRILLEDLQQGFSDIGRFEYVQATAGQISGMIKRTSSAKQMVADMVAQAVDTLERTAIGALGRESPQDGEPGRR